MWVPRNLMVFILSKWLSTMWSVLCWSLLFHKSIIISLCLMSNYQLWLREGVSPYVHALTPFWHKVSTQYFEKLHWNIFNISNVLTDSSLLWITKTKNNPLKQLILKNRIIPTHLNHHGFPYWPLWWTKQQCRPAIIIQRSPLSALHRLGHCPSFSGMARKRLALGYMDPSVPLSYLDSSGHC